MDLTLSDEQRLLRESVDRFITETYDADHRRRVASDPLGFSPDIWIKHLTRCLRNRVQLSAILGDVEIFKRINK
jgi:hypothetical protein